ncbi:MAG TPA: proton-conducting transporter membrane subunit, partial [Candidatus Bathyarchaeia archaeon]
LAYSTVSQIGYMMLALGLAGLSLNFVAGYTAGLFHLMSHAIFKASLFLGAGWVLHAAETRFMDQMGGLAKGMRITAASMVLAGLSLMGIPPFSGFWTKDEILFVGFETGQFALYGLGIATVALTGFYTMRMLGMTFTGKPSHHMEQLEHEGKHVHEAKLTMLGPYLLLAVASLALGMAFPFISEPLAHYVEGTFESLPTALPSESLGGSGLLSLTLIGVSVGTAALGAVLGYLLYFGKEPRPVGKMGALQRFLWNRWYLNAAYYKVFVNGAVAGGRVLYRYLEQGVWDRLNYAVSSNVIDYSRASERLDTRVVDGAVNDVASRGSRLSNFLKTLQTGVTQQYVIAFAAGIFLLLAYMILVIGAE